MIYVKMWPTERPRLGGQFSDRNTVIAHHAAGTLPELFAERLRRHRADELGKAFRATPGGIDFEWNGVDEGDQVSGDGWANLRDDGCLEGEIAYQNGDETTFIAAPWERFSAAC